MSRTAILLSFRTELPSSTGLTCNQLTRTPKQQPSLIEEASASGATSVAVAEIPGPSTGRGRPRARSPVKIAPATPEFLAAKRRQQEMQDIAALRFKSRKETVEEKKKARKKMKLEEMTDISDTVSRRGGGTVRRFTFQPEPEDLMVPPLREGINNNLKTVNGNFR